MSGHVGAFFDSKTKYFAFSAPNFVCWGRPVLVFLHIEINEFSLVKQPAITKFKWLLLQINFPIFFLIIFCTKHLSHTVTMHFEPKLNQYLAVCQNICEIAYSVCSKHNDYFLNNKKQRSNQKKNSSFCSFCLMHFKWKKFFEILSWFHCKKSMKVKWVATKGTT